jgi:hypothetical protein|tara:strand:+ start:6094 stop:7635 length:1542 start_codon:yes stop_codon:yes gene_type:complete
MAWSTDFIAALSAPSITPIYILEVVRVPQGVGAPAFIYSDRGDLQIGRGGVDIQGTSVIPQRWSVSFGGFALELVGDIRPFRNSLIRGALCVLRVSIAGLADERIAIGQLDQIEGVRGVYRASFKDYLSASQSRFDTRKVGTQYRSQWFYGTATKTTVSHVWNPFQTSLQVVSTDDFTKSTGIDGVLYCVPSSGSAPFFMHWSAKDDATDIFTVSGRADHPSTASESLLHVGSEVYNAARVVGAPFSIFAQLITSTGTGTNGPNDRLPESYGNGAPLHHSFFDVADAQNTSSYILPSSGTFYQWDFVFNEPLSGGLRAVMDIAGNVGQWPVMRQNSFSWRGCCDPTGQSGNKPPTSAHIYDDDIISIDGVQFFDPTLSAPFLQTSITYDVSNTTKSVVSNTDGDYLPMNTEIERQFGTRYSTGGSNMASMASGDLDRMQIWDLFHWTKVSLRVRLRFAVLCAGDVVQLTSAFIQDISTQVGDTYNGRNGMVLEVGYNITSRSCILVIGFPPEV